MELQETSWQVPAAVTEQRQKKAEEASVADKANGESAVGTIKKKLHEEDAIAEVGKLETVHQGKQKGWNGRQNRSLKPGRCGRGEVDMTCSQIVSDEILRFLICCRSHGPADMR